MTGGWHKVSELIWTIISLVLTLMVFSYLFGDNILFRIAAYLFVGVASGYVFTIVVYQVILPRLVSPLLSGNFLVIIPLVLGLALLFKLVPRLANIGSLSMAYLVGVGAAVIIGGAVLGTLLGQAGAAINMFDLKSANATGIPPLLQVLGGGFTLLGTIATLAYFHYGVVPRPGQPAQRNSAITWLARFGQVFIGITLGALFAGVFTAALTALVERVIFLKDFFFGLLL
jgi:hypothetical protein